MSLKITTWNIEHADRLLSSQPTAVVLERRKRIRETLEEIGADILCLQEAPAGEKGIEDFSTQVLEREWLPVLLPFDDAAIEKRDKAYSTRGKQWIWFLATPQWIQRCRLQSPQVWQAFTVGDSWPVHLWGETQVVQHSHYRHPQVLLLDVDQSSTIELVGVHLKSKINQVPIERDGEGNLVGDYIRQALEARIKLATEARNIRQYIHAKFEQAAEPAIIVLGDCNDGPGQDFFEEQYLFFDLISNIQGDVILAERFFQHALFDFPAHLRWTARFADPILNLTASQNRLLLDHILLSRSLSEGDLPYRARPGAAKVEHEAFERHNAGASSSAKTSDHRPVSIELDER